jgi:Calcineurin-like phosphoesterase
MPTVSWPASSASRLLAPGARARVLAAGALALLAATTSAEDTWPKVERVVAVGDVHGDYTQLVTVLRDAGLVDAQLAWSGGRTHLVQTGDRIDRGPDSRKVMDLFMRLEKEAKKAGGVVHPLLGNHEAMNVLGDFRYVTPEEFAAFLGPDSKRLVDALFDRFALDLRSDKKPPPTEAEIDKWRQAHPPGYAEYRQALSAKGDYGQWLVRQSSVIRIGDTLFLHGGLSAKYGDFSLADINERIRQELRDGDPRAALMSRDPDGPLWFRGLASGDPALARDLDDILHRTGCKRMVIGHTPTEGLVMPRYGSRVIQIDVGMAKVFGGPPAALILEEGGAFALHRGHRIALPQEAGAPLLRYVREVADLEPDPKRLAALIASLESALSAAPALP